MIKVENVEVWGFEHAIRGMRNPMNSWDKSDSLFDGKDILGEQKVSEEATPLTGIGKNDLDLMRRLYLGGTEHRKYLRQIFVSMDITAPLYWWKEFDTYKVGTVANSCSTMHKIAAKEFEIDDFSNEHLKTHAEKDFVAISVDGNACWYSSEFLLKMICQVLNYYRERYLETKDKDDWWQMIQLLPSSYNQRRTVTMNYENVMTIIKQRTGHKLDEWNHFVDILSDLPYIKEIRDETPRSDG